MLLNIFKILCHIMWKHKNCKTKGQPYILVQKKRISDLCFPTQRKSVLQEWKIIPSSVFSVFQVHVWNMSDRIIVLLQYSCKYTHVLKDDLFYGQSTSMAALPITPKSTSISKFKWINFSKASDQRRNLEKILFLNVTISIMISI